jgi:hypothetical protein
MSIANRDSAPAVAFTDEPNYRTKPVKHNFFTTNNGYKWEGTAALGRDQFLYLNVKES